ncbi:MAG TPA: porin [Ramlibacter sp.]|nr:porin [Ramlibacter sp.]
MKKTLIAMAVLAAAGAASAQSSVTLFGIVDATVQHLKADGNGSVTRLGNSGYNSSRLGFRGTEDLGGGLAASFWLEMGFNNDDGTGIATSSTNQGIAAFNPATGANAPVRSGTQGLTFNRRTTVSLAGGFGELRLGRDYAPSFWNLAVFDAMGANGSGASTNLSQALGIAAGVETRTRASNSIGYFLPSNLGGFYGQAMYALGENASNAGVTEKDGRYAGLRFGYAAGPVNVAVGFGKTNLAALGDYKQANIGASYDLGVAKLFAQYNQEKLAPAGVSTKGKTYVLGASVPVGAGEIRASFGASKADAGAINDAAKARLITLGYVHNLSKRTAVYTTYARIDNKGTVIGYNMGRAASTPAGDNQGFDIGLRHSF